jgi:ribose/xylose/arabinose/galactoside ABC-type transport system permease subunit
MKKNILTKKFLAKYFLLMAIILVSITFGLKEPAFRQIDNLLDIIRSGSIIGLMGIGISYAMIAGEFDFSIGAVATFTACMTGLLLANPNFNNFLLAIFFSMILACVIGLVNAFNTLKIGIPAFIATLGLSTLLNGITKFITGGGVFYALNWPKTFVLLGQGMINKIIPIPAIIFFIGFLFAWNHTERTRTGRYLFSVGSNSIAAAHVGINVKKTKAIAFIFSAFFAGFAGIIQGSTLGSITPGMGDGNLLPAISAAMLGATFLRPGIPNIPGTVIGALLLAVISNGLTMIGASFFMKDIIQGIILLISVGIIATIKEGNLAGVEL